MRDVPDRIFLDTNVYIIGAAVNDSPEAAILEWAGFGATSSPHVEVIFSEALLQQILRVARRLHGKDWGGEILAQIWQGINVRFVLLDLDDIERWTRDSKIPREDVEIYLAAKTGEVDCFVSANRELVRISAEQQGDFECLEPQAFVAKYLES